MSTNSATAGQLQAQLATVRAALPLRSPLLIGCGLVLLASILGLPLNDHPAWWFLVPVALAALATGLDELRGAGVPALAGWPAARSLRTVAFALLLVLSATITVQLLAFSLVAILWVVALLFVIWGVAVRRSELDLRVGLDPGQLVHGYRAVLLIGGAVALVSMVMNWGSGPSSIGPGEGYGCNFGTNQCGLSFGYGSTFFAGYPYDGRNVEFGGWAVLALLLVLAAGMLTVGQASRWLRRFGPLTGAAAISAWFIWALFGSVLIPGGDKSFGFFLFIVGLLILDLGALVVAAGFDDGRYSPAAFVNRLRANASSPPPPPPPPPLPAAFPEPPPFSGPISGGA